ncbi:unnamed protein product [Parascedosporium putredinis]|uniref:DUF6536 domain-containing protein n=1 Tax=Parascedosporium putredinis TaxID=1442378 RepID=A0A9P1M6Q1_9PEZI|nr:unnamed protein product [Parascedosporium putredinis]CAI7990130.1 unnamed protein product [Parascedosporium putredinis]
MAQPLSRSNDRCGEIASRLWWFQLFALFDSGLLLPAARFLVSSPPPEGRRTKQFSKDDQPRYYAIMVAIGDSAGWRKAGIVAASSTWALSIVTLILLIISVHRLGSGSVFTTTVIFDGKCSDTNVINTALHAFVNIVASLVLASSNYFMQVLSAPTREAIDAAHARGRSSSSVPLHLFFNSSVAETRTSSDYYMVLATEAFLDGADYAIPGAGYNATAYYVEWAIGPDWLHNDTGSDAEIARIAAEARAWARMELDECLDIYNSVDEALTTHRHVVVVVADPDQPDAEGWDVEDDGRVNSVYGARAVQLSESLVASRKADSLVWGPESRGVGARRPGNVTAQYCLSEPFVAPCEIRVHNLLLLISCLCCLFKAFACTTVVVSRPLHAPLLTLGDAVESFLRNPDTSTRGMCWLDRSASSCTNTRLPGPRWWGAGAPRPDHLCLGIIGCWPTGLPSVNISTTTFGPSAQNPLLSILPYETETTGNLQVAASVTMAAIVNTPQILLSIAYLAYNGLFTRMHGEREWSSYSVKYKPLRVSYARGLQTVAYRLQLPFRWSIPLISLSALLHWLVSNCLYIRDSRILRVYVTTSFNDDLMFSPGISIQFYDYDEAGDAYLKHMARGEIKWGVVSGDETACTEKDPGHLAFGSRAHDVRAPVLGSEPQP